MSGKGPHHGRQAVLHGRHIRHLVIASASLSQKGIQHPAINISPETMTMACTTLIELKTLATQVFDRLCINRDLDSAAKHLSPDVQVFHDDHSALQGRAEFISHWSSILKFVPELKVEILESVAELNENNDGGRVWFLTKYDGLPGNISKSSVDMLEVVRGEVTVIKDVQREIIAPAA